jgi:ATP-dependent Clp protease protease subunit
MAEHTGQPIEVIERDTERDRFMDADQSREYGLIDEVIAARGSAARDATAQ